MTAVAAPAAVRDLADLADDDHESLLFPPPDARLQFPSGTGGGRDGATTASR